MTPDTIKSICAAFERATSGHVSAASLPTRPPCLVAWVSRSLQRPGRLARWRKIGISICLSLAWLSSGQVAQAQPDQRAKEIVDQVARLFASQSSIATVEMQIAQADFQRKISMQFWSQGASKILIRINQPLEDAGTTILKDGDHAWMYLPKSDRVVAMPPSMMTTPWMGSHFTLSDLVNQTRLTNDYVVTTSFEGSRDGVAVWEFTLTPKPSAPVVWEKIVLQVRRADMMPVWQRYYDQYGAMIREMSFSAYKTVSGRLIPTRLTMRQRGQMVEQTTITYENIVFDVPISADIFTMGKKKQ